jgi:hypothetical protein
MVKLSRRALNSQLQQGYDYSINEYIDVQGQNFARKVYNHLMPTGLKNPSTPQDMCTWAFQLLQAERSAAHFDFRRFHDLFRSALGQQRHHCTNERHESIQGEEIYAQGPYDRDYLSDINLSDGNDDLDLESGWGYAGVMGMDQEDEGTTKFKSQRVSLKELLTMASRSLSQTSVPRHGNNIEIGEGIRYFHLPANHTRWVEVGYPFVHPFDHIILRARSGFHLCVLQSLG